MKRKYLSYLALAVLSLGLTGCSNTKQSASSTQPAKSAEKDLSTKSSQLNKRMDHDQAVYSSHNYQTGTKSINPNLKPFKYDKGKRKMVIYKYDSLGRSVGSHIQLKRSELPTNQRSSYLTIRPSGWHNYKFTTDKNGRPYTTWLYNRGHLVGYQFCGLNQAEGNMITQTTYTNQGSLTGMNDKNKKGQLYYENLLRSWIDRHPSDSLDYSVTPLYHGKNLVPDRIRFRFVGYSTKGKQIKINAHSSLAHTKGKVSTVTIKNSSPQAKIDYRTGRATIKSMK